MEENKNWEPHNWENQLKQKSISMTTQHPGGCLHRRAEGRTMGLVCIRRFKEGCMWRSYCIDRKMKGKQIILISWGRKNCTDTGQQLAWEIWEGGFGEGGMGWNRKGSHAASRELNFLWLVSVDWLLKCPTFNFISK